MNEFEGIFDNNFIPENVCFWTGAGISADYPSALPLGNAFTQNFVSTYCGEGTWDKICEYFDKAHMKDALGNAKQAPRLEAVLESIINNYGLDCLKPLEPLYYAYPNYNHLFFAKHLCLKGSHITTNFDSCIQNAANTLGCKDRIHDVYSSTLRNQRSDLEPNNILLHIHGKYLPGGSNASDLGLRVSRVANGILSPFDNLLKDIISQKKYLLFLGYSGSDYFDINPFFYNLKNEGLDLRRLVVVWINHSSGANIAKVPNWKEKRKSGSVILAGIQDAGATVHYLDVHTRNFIEIIDKTWGLNISDDALFTGKTINILEEFDKYKIEKNTRRIASSHLFSTMGIGKEVVAERDNLLSLVPEDKRAIFLISNGFRDVGLYRQALCYSKKLPVDELSDVIFREGRMAGDYWLMGNDLLAGFHFLKGILLYKNKVKKLKDLGVGVYEELLLDFLHWFRDIKRNRSFVGQLLPLRFASESAKFLINNPDYLFVKPHSLGKLTDLFLEIKGLEEKVKLPKWAMIKSLGSVSVFQETDSVLGVNNFTRRKLLINFIQNRVIPSSSEIEELIEMSSVIEDRAGLLKASVYLKKFYGIEHKNALKSLLEIEWTLEKKIKWLFEWTRA